MIHVTYTHPPPVPVVTYHCPICDTSGPCRVLDLRDPIGQPIIWDQPDGERWRSIFVQSPRHWRGYKLRLAYPDGRMVVLVA